MLALREGRPLFLIVAVRQPGIMRFDVHAEQILDGSRSSRDPAEIRELVARLIGALERHVRAHPDQYNWLHRRWKSRPYGETPGPHLPAYDHHRPAADRQPVSG